MSAIIKEERIGGQRLILGDCLEVMPLLNENQAILTDPPYGIFKKTGGNGKMFGKETIYSEDDKAAKWDVVPDDLFLKQLLRFPEYTIWGGNYLADSLGSSKGVLIWYKRTGNNSYADCELAWTNTTATSRLFDHQWCGAFKDSERGQRAVHPTQKPIALMEWCLKKTKSQTILDPFMGSGTTLVACQKLGRQGTGIELDEDYFKISCERVHKAYMQPDMFIEPIKASEPEQIKMAGLG